jgi:uncharacterized membrane protein
MANHAISFGVALVIVGLFGYFGYETQSLTALIPAVVGLLLVISGIVGQADTRRKHAMHVAATVSLLGAFSAWGFAIELLTQGKDANTMVLLMGIICTLFVYLCIRSFTAARNAREEESSDLDEPAAGE